VQHADVFADLLNVVLPATRPDVGVSQANEAGLCLVSLGERDIDHKLVLAKPLSDPLPEVNSNDRHIHRHSKISWAKPV
jgi:hypothetical protein